MTEYIKPGDILLAAGTPLPASLQDAEQYAGTPFVPGWNWVKNLDSHGMDHLLHKAGWKFFYLAGGFEMIAFDADREHATRKALQRILASLKTKPPFNCLEITHVAAKSFLSWPYVSVSAHLRHVQQSPVLFAR